MTDHAAPSLAALAAEVRVVAEWAAGRLASRRLARAHAGDGRGRAVLVIPGFLADDRLTGLLRLTLARAGYRPHGWGLGRNTGVTRELFDRLLDRVDALAGDDGQVTLVGWSLGGLYARELAKHRPARVERVVTLGSPFSGDPRANHAWRHYERINGHPVDRPPVSATPGEKPPVPTIALWSTGDGIVAPATTRGLPDESDRRIRVGTSHLGLVAAPAALRGVLDALGSDVSREGA